MARMKKTEAKRVPKKKNWTAPLMTEKEKQEVRSLMTKRTKKLEAKYGEITMKQVKQLIATRSLQMLLQKTMRQPADVAWAWVAEQQTQGQLMELMRMCPGTKRRAEENWQRYAAQASGWVAKARSETSQDDVEMLREWRTR